MATIRAVVAEKFHQEGDLSNDDGCKWLFTKLEQICFALPCENNSETNPIGVEFSNIMFLDDCAFPSMREYMSKCKDEHEKAIWKVIAKIQEERDDLCDYPNLRQMIVDAINGWR